MHDLTRGSQYHVIHEFSLSTMDEPKQNISSSNTPVLRDKHCVPCEGGTAPLQSAQIKEYLQALSGWRVEEEKQLVKEYRGKDFAEALAFVDASGKIAETEGHHPDINLHSWNKVTLTLSTHAIGGLSINDFILAAKIDEMKRKNFPNIV